MSDDLLARHRAGQDPVPGGAEDSPAGRARAAQTAEKAHR